MPQIGLCRNSCILAKVVSRDAVVAGKFSIIDFYLSVCGKYDIYGCYDASLRLLDVGKQDTLKIANDFAMKYMGKI